MTAQRRRLLPMLLALCVWHGAPLAVAQPATPAPAAAEPATAEPATAAPEAAEPAAAEPAEQRELPPPPPSYQQAPAPPIGQAPQPEMAEVAEQPAGAPATEEPVWDFPERRPQERTPHQGIYLRLHLGIAGWNARFSPDERGAGLAFSVALGGSLSESLVLFAELDVMSSGEGRATSSSMLGVGLAYWLLGPNVYLAGSLGGGQGNYRLDVGDDSSTVWTDGALNLKLQVGKEWLVSDAWGLGAALALRHARYDEGPFTGLAGVFSATWH